MKYASIDIGTNSVRLLIADYDGTVFSDIQKRVQVTRLGRGVNETGVLSEESMSNTIDAVALFSEGAKAAGALEVFIMATSAARDAKNSETFLNRLEERVGIRAQIISGDVEAEIGFKGVLLGMPELVDEKKPQLVIDIGGGSTELIVGSGDGILFAKSLNMGSVRMTGAYVNSDPISDSDYSAMQTAIEAAVETVKDAISQYPIQRAIGIGGTAATFATIDKKMPIYDRDGVHGAIVSTEKVRRINAMLRHDSIEERKAIVGLEEKRADVILAGGLILETVLEQFDCPFVQVSDSDNLEGFIAYNVARENP